MKRTLVLVFIHGFKGGDDTFEKFPDHLRTLVADALPKVNVLATVYPRFDTRGDLHDCVARFKEWLQNKVIDLEAAAQTPSPTIDPGVRVVLCGHSMGGIVAAETLLSIARDSPLPSSRIPQDQATRNNTTEQANTASDPSSTSATLNMPDPEQRSSSAPPTSNDTNPDHRSSTAATDPLPDTSFLFPFIQGILAFDTPYLGIHPGVVAHGAESHFNTASAAVSAYNNASKFFGLGGKNASSATQAVDASRALPAAGGNATGGGGSWGRYAMFAGGAAALAAVGSAAYMKRDQISSGWNWVGSHLAFVGCLARGAEMAARVEAVVKVGERHGVGFADFYTKLGGKEGGTKVAGQLLGEARTFCVVPKDVSKQDERQGSESPAKKRKTAAEKSMGKGTWIEAVNTKAEDEIGAHTAMFTPRDHPGYYSMSDKARNLVVTWVDNAWYEGSSEEA